MNLKTMGHGLAGPINEWNQDVKCVAAEASAESVWMDCVAFARIRAPAPCRTGALACGVSDLRSSRREPLAKRWLSKETLAGQLMRGSASRAVPHPLTRQVRT